MKNNPLLVAAISVTAFLSPNLHAACAPDLTRTLSIQNLLTLAEGEAKWMAWTITADRRALLALAGDSKISIYEPQHADHPLVFEYQALTDSGWAGQTWLSGSRLFWGDHQGTLFQVDPDRPREIRAEHQGAPVSVLPRMSGEELVLGLTQAMQVRILRPSTLTASGLGILERGSTESAPGRLLHLDFPVGEAIPGPDDLVAIVGGNRLQIRDLAKNTALDSVVIAHSHILAPLWLAGSTPHALAYVSAGELNIRFPTSAGLLPLKRSLLSPVSSSLTALTAASGTTHLLVTGADKSGELFTLSGGHLQREHEIPGAVGLIEAPDGQVLVVRQLSEEFSVSPLVQPDRVLFRQTLSPGDSILSVAAHALGSGRILVAVGTRHETHILELKHSL